MSNHCKPATYIFEVPQCKDWALQRRSRETKYSNPNPAEMGWITAIPHLHMASVQNSTAGQYAQRLLAANSPTTNPCSAAEPKGCRGKAARLSAPHLLGLWPEPTSTSVRKTARPPSPRRKRGRQETNRRGVCFNGTRTDGGMTHLPMAACHLRKMQARDNKEKTEEPATSANQIPGSPGEAPM